MAFPEPYREWKGFTPLYHQFSETKLPVLRLFAVIILLLMFTSASSFAALSPDEQMLLSHVNVGPAMHTIERLCANDFEGRRAGSIQSDMAADYLVAQFQDEGISKLNLPGIEGYKQPLTMRYTLVNSKDDIRATLSYKIAGKRGPVEKTQIFPYSEYNGHGGLTLKSDVVFVGYGIHDPADGYDDYSGLDVHGKIVLWIPGAPKNAHLHRSFTSTEKLIAAYEHGAVACLLCKSKAVKDYWGTNIGLSGAIADFPYISVDRTTASNILGRPGDFDLSKLKGGAHGSKVRLHITQIYDPNRLTYNVLATLPGTDPVLSHQIVMVGAHYDHLGADRVGIYRGADDNASGTSVVLEVANAIRESGLSPKRTIVFACWTAEEAGLIGSNYFANHPPFPLSSIVSNFELDMVGEGRSDLFMTTGARDFPKHYAYLASSAADLGITLNADTVRGASDHLSFSRKHVPTSLLYSGGEHPYYHTIRDVPSAISPKVLESAARLTTLAVWRAANP